MRLIVEFHRDLGSVEGIHNIYPQLRLEQIRGVVAWDEAHPGRVTRLPSAMRAPGRVVERPMNELRVR
jgi:hypothetical protein